MTRGWSSAAACFRAATTSVSQWTWRCRHSSGCGRTRASSFGKLSGVRSALLPGETLPAGSLSWASAGGRTSSAAKMTVAPPDKASSRWNMAIPLLCECSRTRSALLLRGKIGAIVLFPIHVDQGRDPVDGLVAAHQREGNPQRRAPGPLEASALVVAAPVVADHDHVEARERFFLGVVGQHTAQAG